MSEHINKVKEEEKESPEMVTLQGEIDDGDNARLTKKRFRTETKNKQVECKVCLRKMRSDTIKRHIKKHRDLYSLNENDMREEIKERKRQYDIMEERKRLVREIAQQEGTPLECIEDQTVRDTKTLKEELLQNNIA